MRRVSFIILTVFALASPIILRWWYLDWRETSIKHELYPYIYKSATIIGIVDEEPRIQGKGQSLVIKTDSVSSTSAVTRILISTHLYPRYSYGDQLRMVGKLVPPRNFGGNDSSDSLDNSGRDFDYIHYLSKDGIFYTIRSPTISVLGNGKGNMLVASLLYIKEQFEVRLNKVLGEPHASLAAGIMFGDKTALGKDLLDDFRRSGLIHIVILSGFSINIIAASIRSMFSFLPRLAGISCSAIGIVLFALLVGAKTTVLRACIMSLIGLLATALYKDYNGLRALLFTAYVMLIQNPYIAVYDASFQVSFTATLGLILFGPSLRKFFSFLPEQFEIRTLVVSTIATQISVTPLLLYMMGDISLVSLGANLIVVPFVPVTMLSIVLTGLAGFVGHYISFVLAVVAFGLLSYELYLVEFFAHMPYSTIAIHAFPLWLMWCMYIGYALILWQLRNYSRSPPS